MTDAALHDPFLPTPRRSAMPAWFDPAGPHLIGQRCTSCGSTFFPPTLDFCQNPSCAGDAFDMRALSTHGKVWSWTTNHYKPPAPAISSEPFKPYTVVAVELAEEAMVVLGQLSDTSASIDVNDAVQLCSEVLISDDSGEQLVWRWTKATEKVTS